jgi:hypothetical protein
VVAAKSLLAAALFSLVGVVSLVYATVALGDSPTVKITKADQAAAVAALLRQSDFGAGWRGGPTTPSKLTAPSCPGFNPKESDLVVNGHAEAKFSFPQSGVEFDQDVQVLATPEAVQKDFARTVRPQLAECLAYQLRKASNVTRVTVSKIQFPSVGTVSAVYRATILVQGPNGAAKFLSDYVFFGEGRLEYAFNVVAPVGAGDQLVRFESAMAEILLKRVGAAAA